MLSLNLDLPIRIFNFHPSAWLNNRKLRLFDFEFHFSPFMDLALLQGPYNNLKNDPHEGSKFNFRDMIRTAGFEIIAFSGFFRSLHLRASVGSNLRKGRALKWDEIYIGTELHF